MKKILVLLLLTVSSILSASSNNNYIYEDDVLKFDLNTIDNSIVIFFNMEDAWSCTANVYYNGTLIRSFTVVSSSAGHACMLARAQAENYIASQQLHEHYILQEHPGIPDGGDDPIFP